MNPYENLPPKAFWRRAVAENSMYDVSGLWNPKFKLSPKMPVSTYGSCFAQHIGRQFKARGYQFVDVEKPLPMLPESAWNDYGFNMYSARYGNLYSARQLLQMFRRAHGLFTPEEDVWEKNGRFYDPFRPNIEKNGYATPEEVRRDRDFHLAAVRRILEQTDVFVFTFGLTEAWDIEFASHNIRVRSLMPGFIDTGILSAVGEDSNQTGKERLQAAGIEVSPVSMIGPAAWDAVHGNAVHTPVNKMARQLMFAARFFPGRVRKRMGLLNGLDEAAED